MLNKLFGLPQRPARIATKAVQNETGPNMRREFAQEISERALIFLANRPDDIQRFLTASGLDADDLLARSGDSAILSAVLTFLCSDESIAKEFSEEERLKPGLLLQACATLDPHGSSAW